VESVVADVGDEYDVRDVVDAAVRLFGGVDILVNNAGIYPSAPLARLSAPTFDRVVSVNLRGVYLFTQRVTEQLKAQGLDVEKRMIDLHEPIRALGVYKVPIKLHADVKPEIKVWVIKA